MYPSGSRTPGRRLSVPVGGNPFQSPHGTGNLGRPLFGHGSMNASNSAALHSPNSSYLGSPTTTTSTTSGWHRRESSSSAAEEAWRRRTWHPDSSNLHFTPPGSRLSQVITSSQLEPRPEPLPALNHNGPHQQPAQTVRLPGINSLLTKPDRPPSPTMVIDSERGGPGPQPPLLPSAAISDDRRMMQQQWDMGLHRGLTRLEISNNTTPPPPRDGAGAWANEVQQAMQARVEHAQPQGPPPVRSYQPTVRFEPEPHVVGHPYQHSQPPPRAIPRGHQHTMSAPLMPSVRGENKRHGWYNGPVTVHEDRVLEGQGQGHRPHVDRIAHPNLHAFGFPPRDLESEKRDNPDSRRFDALVAVATSEGSTAQAC